MRVGQFVPLIRASPEASGPIATSIVEPDASKPEVAAWMESELARIIQKYNLDMYRIDFNTLVEDGGNRVNMDSSKTPCGATWMHSIGSSIT